MGSLDLDEADDCLREQWVQDLLQIQGLDTLFIGLSPLSGIGIKADFASLLTSRMVVGGPGLDRKKFQECWLSEKVKYVWAHYERSMDGFCLT